MKKRLIAFLGISSPLVLLFICVVGVVLVGVVGGWFFDEEENARIIRIISLAPLTTPQAIESQAQEQEPSPPSELAESEVNSGLQEPLPPTEIAQAEVDNPVTPEEVEEKLGFPLPEGSVNSLTSVGLANRLVIPELNLDAPIVLSPIENQTWKVDDLGQAVGHLEGTAPPGSNSNLVLAAHVTISAGVNGPFYELSHLVPGDVVFVYEEGQEFQYVVDRMKTVDRAAIDVTFPTSTGQITLITCSNWDNNEKRYTERLVVTGHLVES